MATTLDEPIVLSQHLVLTGVSWSYYEHTLEQIGNQYIRVAFLDGNLEIMSPLPEHEIFKRAVGRLIETLTFELRVPHKSYGSTTFRVEGKGAGVEADESYYLHDIEAVKSMKRFDPSIHRAPDLVVEIDLFSPSVPREPIYARLGVREIWRFDGRRLGVGCLSPEGTYLDSPASGIFPLLPLQPFAAFVMRMIDEDGTQVLVEFADWVRQLPRG